MEIVSTMAKIRDVALQWLSLYGGPMKKAMFLFIVMCLSGFAGFLSAVIHTAYDVSGNFSLAKLVFCSGSLF
jgi:hypothetical protein